MRDILVVIVFLLLCASVTSGEMTGTFVRCFREWTNADQVKVLCNGNIMIAQYCNTGNQSCRKMNNSGLGVSLEKDGFACLTITNLTYDSWSCEAQGYIDGNEQTDTFTVNFINLTSSSPSPGSTSSPSPVTTSSPSPGSTSTSPNPDNNESHSGSIAAGVSVSIIFFLLLLLLILYILYRKVKCFKQATRDFFSFLPCNNRNPKEDQGIGTGEKFLQSGSMV